MLYSCTYSSCQIYYEILQFRKVLRKVVNFDGQDRFCSGLVRTSQAAPPVWSESVDRTILDRSGLFSGLDTRQHGAGITIVRCAIHAVHVTVPLYAGAAG